MNSIDLSSQLNYDLKPITFFYNIVLWTTKMNQNIKDLFVSLYSFKLIYLYLLLIPLFLLLYFTAFRKEKNIILSSIGCVGFTQISLEIIVILLYQILRGNLYENIGLIFFSFMLGLTIGSYLFPFIKINTLTLFRNIQLLFIVIPILILPLFNLLSFISIDFIQDLVFVTFILFLSILSGLQFPAAVNLFPDKDFGPGKINGIDLISAALGAFVVTLFLIPLFGIVQTILLISLINLFMFVCMNRLGYFSTRSREYF